jgi:hypothetical protein
MRRILVAGLVILIVSGCAKPPQAVFCSQAAGPKSNLLLNSRAADAREALALNTRSEWPATESGYRFDELTLYTTLGYSYVQGYDRFGGLYHGTEMVETGVWLR